MGCTEVYNPSYTPHLYSSVFFNIHQSVYPSTKPSSLPGKLLENNHILPHITTNHQHDTTQHTTPHAPQKETSTCMSHQLPSPCFSSPSLPASPAQLQHPPPPPAKLPPSGPRLWRLARPTAQATQGKKGFVHCFKASMLVYIARLHR